MGSEPLSLSLGCLTAADNVSENFSSLVASPFSTNSLNRRKLKKKSNLFRRSWGPADKDLENQALSISVTEQYNIIMGTEMHDMFQMEGKGQSSTVTAEFELSWDPADVSPSYEWSYSEFLDQYNELYEWLIQVQLQLYSNSNPPDKATRITQQEELNRQAFRRKLFVEQGEKVAIRYPSSADEISWRVNYLKNKWEQLLTTLTPRKGQTKELEVELDLAHEEEILCEWLSSMESEIQPITCRLPKGSSVLTLQERYKDNQILLKDIEAHGPILKSVIRQYERLARKDANDQSAKSLESSTTATPPTSHNHCSESPKAATLFSAIEGGKTRKGSNKVPRRARALEKRWHQIYLRSLEWHYHLEGAINNFKNQPCSSNSSESEDEPLSKCRRISIGSSPPSRRRARSNSWREDELTGSETGSYIEDDFVHIIGSISPRDQRKRIRRDSSDAVVPMETIEYEPILQRTTVTASTSPLTKSRSVSIEDITMVEKDDKKSDKPELIDENNEDKDESNIMKDSPVKSLSNLTEVDRPSVNSGVFDCRHSDTDSEDKASKGATDEHEVNDNNETNTEKITVARRSRRMVQQRSPYRRCVFPLPDFSNDEEADQEDLQRIIDSAILEPNWLDTNLTSDSESMESLPKDDCVNCSPGLSTSKPGEQNSELIDDAINGNDRVVPLIHQIDSHSMTSSQESIHRLINEVDHLVNHQIIPSPRQCLKPLSFGINEKSKQRRIEKWISNQRNDSGATADSCDASSELTTGESDIDSESSCRNLDNSTLHRSSYDHLASSENTPTADLQPTLQLETLCKVVRRGKKRHQNNQRPWSMSEFQQLATSAKGNHNSTSNEKFNFVSKGSLSASESVLNSTFIDSSEQPPQEPTTPSPEDNDKTMTLLTPGDSFSLSENLSSDPATPASVGKGNSPSDAVKKKKPKFRRRSLKYSGRRTDSGSDDVASGSRVNGNQLKIYSHSPYHHSIIKDLSSEQEESTAKENLITDTDKVVTALSAVQTLVCENITLSVNQVPSIASTPRTNNGPLSPRSCGPFTPRTNPSDNDAANTQDSSLSEQAWDPYQELKYLSEPYSEDFDNEAARRLQDFGDDYRKYIDSDNSSLRFPLSARSKSRKSPNQYKRIRNYRPEQSDDAEDSDLEDLFNVIKESKSQLAALENDFDKGSLTLHFNELLITAQTNMNCLQEILKHLQCRTSKFHSELNLVQSLLQRWKSLESKMVERQRQSTQQHQLQCQMKSFKKNLDQINYKCSILAHPHSLAIPSELKQKAEEAKSLLDETEGLKEELSALNVVVHRFSVDVGGAALKDEIADLYRVYDETCRKVNAEVSRFESAEATWRLWDEQKSQLLDALKQDSETLNVLDAAFQKGGLTESVTASVQDVAKLLNDRRKGPQKAIADIQSSGDSRSSTSCSLESKDGHLSDSGTSGYESCSSDDLSERERRLAYLRRLARDLEANLVPDSKAWNDISATLSHAEQELQGLQSQCRNLVRKTAETFDQNSFKTGFSTTNSSPRRRSWSRERKLSGRNNKKRSFRGSWIGRVVKAALPFQVTLLLMLVVACLLEPNCCDSLNTLNLTWSPQLRYVHGHTPV